MKSMNQPGPLFAVDAICFDLLTALLNSWTLWEVVAAEAGAAALGQPWRHAALRLVTASGDYRPYGELVEAAAGEVGLPAGLSRVLIDRWGELAPWPEVPAMLARIERPMATATNCPEVLAHVGVAALGNPFTVVVSAERAGAYKPDPRPYQLALHELDLPPERVLFVAGSSHDAVGAVRMGMPVVWVNRLGLPTPPGAETALILTDLAILPDLVA
jgi:2-haloalkanoic acid dehalogenase type II